MNEPLTYPQYRKYPNNKGYFKIISPDEWEEIKVVGSKMIVHTYRVNIFPDRNYINDLTFDYQHHWAKIEAPEYEEIKARIENTH